MVYDARREECIRFGGWSVGGGLHHETLTWTGADWLTLTEIGPSERYQHVMAYDRDRDRIVFFGGEGWPVRFPADTWEFGARCPRLEARASCPGGGPIGVEWSEATPQGEVAVLFAPQRGSHQINASPVCSHMTLGLATPGLTLVARARSDSAGAGSLRGRAGANACGGYLELLDLPTCRQSSVARIE